MNKIDGHISRIDVDGHLSVVTVRIEDILLSAVMLESRDSAPWLYKGAPISVLFKETEVVLGIGENHRISVQNRIPGTILQLEKGNLLAKVLLETPVGQITAVLPSRAISDLGLRKNTEVMAMIKLNEIMLSAL